MTLDDLKRFDLIYLGTPYTAFPRGHDQAALEAAWLSNALWLRGVKHYSPIIEGHALTKANLIDPLNVEFWIEFCQPKIDKSDAFLIGQMESWEISKGIGREIDIFLMQGKPIFHLDPATLGVERAPALRTARQLGAV